MRRRRGSVRALKECFVRSMLMGVAIILLGLCNMHSSAGQTTTAAQSQKRAACVAPEYRQFDFWLGDWDTFELNAPDKSIARNHVDGILDGCALREVYEQTDGLTGQSFTIYDATRKVWHQSWVTNRGQLLTIEGVLQNDRMVLVGDDRAADGKVRKLRGT